MPNFVGVKPTIMAELKKDYQFFLDNKEELVKKYGGMHIVISNQKVMGCYDNENDAYYDAAEKYGLGNFIIQLCTADESEYTMTFHSRVSFA